MYVYTPRLYLPLSLSPPLNLIGRKCDTPPSDAASETTYRLTSRWKSMYLFFFFLLFLVVSWGIWIALIRRCIPAFRVRLFTRRILFESCRCLNRMETWNTTTYPNVSIQILYHCGIHCKVTQFWWSFDCFFLSHGYLYSNSNHYF